MAAAFLAQVKTLLLHVPRPAWTGTSTQQAQPAPTAQPLTASTAFSAHRLPALPAPSLPTRSWPMTQGAALPCPQIATFPTARLAPCFQEHKGAKPATSTSWSTLPSLVQER